MQTLDGFDPSISVVAHCIHSAVEDNVLQELITVACKIDAGEGVLGNVLWNVDHRHGG